MTQSGDARLAGAALAVSDDWSEPEDDGTGEAWPRNDARAAARIKGSANVAVLFEVGVEYEFRVLEWGEGALTEHTFMRKVRAVEGPLVKVVADTDVELGDSGVYVVEAPDHSEQIINTTSPYFVRAVRQYE